MLTNEEKRERQAEILRLAQVMRDNRIKRRSSNEEMAGVMKVSPTSLSEWRRGIRLMEGENIYRVGEDIDVRAASQKLGYTIYEVLNVPPPMNSPLLRDIVYHWDLLSPEEQDQIQQLYLSMIEKKRNGGGLLQTTSG